MNNFNFTTFKSFMLLLSGLFILGSCDNAADHDKTDKKDEKVYVSGGEVNTPPQNQPERGQYLVAVAGCNDCHTPKIFGKEGMMPDASRLLSGHPENAELPAFDPKKTTPGNWMLLSPTLTAAVGPWGASFSANLTPDSATGLGKYTEDNFMQAIRTGKHMGTPDGRPIMPPMPWQELKKMTDDDLRAVYAYLRTIKPVKNNVPAPIPPNELARISKGGKVEVIPMNNDKSKMEHKTGKMK